MLGACAGVSGLTTRGEHQGCVKVSLSLDGREPRRYASQWHFPFAFSGLGAVLGACAGVSGLTTQVARSRACEMMGCACGLNYAVSMSVS